ncbi:MAG: rhomboid family intramembrane serine protease [Candidatus Yanofskybacteria bacterium]|nr:rhomboid family intramembrane serine protease [Candidatus Yanofskybacteria bacterium]
MIPIPIHDEAEQSLLRPPIILLGLILANVLVFLWTYFLSFNAESFLLSFGLIPQNVIGYHKLYTLTTSVFLHAGWLHLIGNMWFLWLFGDNVEDAMGRVKFLIFYILVGALAGLFYAVTAVPAARAEIAIGASGAISGVLGGYMVLFPKNRVKLWWMYIWGHGVSFSVPMYVFALGWFVLQFIYGISSDLSNIGYAAHIGGFASGAILARLFEKKILRMDFNVVDGFT